MDVKIGLSSYSLVRALESKEMTIVDAIRWTAEHGGEHIEIVPIGFSLKDNPGLADEIREQAANCGIDVSNYAIGANFITDSDEAYEQEIKRVMREVDMASRLGVKLMRHDVASRPRTDIAITKFREELPRLAEACRRIADYAAQYGIVTSVENHGYYVQASDRVQALVHEVNRPNFRTTLDIGNFLCADENPVLAVRKNLPIASMVHLKDFYVRPPQRNPGAGWFQSAGGYYLRGAILGHGDLELWEIMKLIKSSGYDGYMSVEFEGMEACREASLLGMEQARNLWEQV